MRYTLACSRIGTGYLRMSRPRYQNRRHGLPWIVVVLVGLALAGGAYWWWSRSDGDNQSGYRTTPVERGDIRVAISSTGTLSAISMVTVGSQISGQVTEVLVDFNSPVKQGDVLARIDPSTYEAQIVQGSAQILAAQAALRLAQATLRNAELDYQRKSSLADQQLVARSDLDLAIAARDQAQAQVVSAQAQIRQQTASTQTSRLNLNRTVIRSPVDGVVLTRTIEPGQTVAASLQSPELFQIAVDLSKMKIELAVDESDIGQVKAGQTVSFTADAFPEREFRGVVEQVRLAATTTSNVVTYPVVVTVDNSDGVLLPGLTVNAEIEVSKRSNVLKVANAALRYKPAADPATANQPPGINDASDGQIGDLVRIATRMQLSTTQRAAFDRAVASIRQRQAAREAQPQAQGNSMFGTGRGMGGPRIMIGGPTQDVGAQRQRITRHYQTEFGAFRALLDQDRRKTWDAELLALISARHAPVYKLVGGVPQQHMVRIGVSDGTNTEISGDIAHGDELVIGERAASAAIPPAS